MKEMRNIGSLRLYGIDPGEEGSVDDEMTEVKGWIENVEQKESKKKYNRKEEEKEEIILEDDEK